MSDLLRPLICAIEAVRTRISRHKTYLEGHETRTRVSLVDPVLRALDWDPSDPESVALEHKIGAKSADYALRGDDGNPVAIVEAKTVGKSLGGMDQLGQIGMYALGSSVRLVALTDGDRWRLHDLKKVETEGGVVFDTRLSSGRPTATAMQLLELWRPRVCAQQTKSRLPPPGPVVARKDANSPQPGPVSKPASANDDWVPFEKAPTNGHHPPQLLRFEDESDERNWSPLSWADVVSGVIHRLYERGLLRETDMPIRRPRNKHFVRHHAEIEKLTRGQRIQGTPFAFSGHGNNDAHAKRVKTLLHGRGAPSLLARPGQRNDE